ncbi:replication restart helicase PriA [Candidatus Chromulinivorax destructor]|uniref:Replication restart protein PriA n=1 Tax=Candidatus Chromulinivorax destructor TaxID=2066483 RepID=A0A345ZBV3_9BACT|nr:primosomal protein N' [Candidatus Chromulinivorax destructor]AXK60770.1 primosomal protein N' [Candidatus Chromulinivorax destructor]
MYITVRLLNNFAKELTYAVPADLCSSIAQGAMVQVPLQKRLEAAIVVCINDPGITYPFKIRPIDSIYPFPADTTYHQFAAQISSFHQIDPLYILKRVKNFLAEKEDEDELELKLPEYEKIKEVVLTDEQEAAYQAVAKDIKDKIYQATVLHGVTGSGKTEVYKKLIASVLAADKSAMLLLPEVSLAVQFEKLLQAQMPNIEIFGFHSATTVKQKRILWQALLSNKPCLIIGVHLPIFLPIANLGIIIVDEEHDAGYQEKNHPKIHSRNAALLKASLLKIPVLLGSATPSISSLFNVESKKWRLLTLKNRFAGQFPSVQVVALSDKKERKNFWISSQLYSAIQHQLVKKEQTIIFLNRRGFSFFVQCTGCTFIFSCNNCSVSLTLHEDGRLICHYCNFVLPSYEICPDCKGKEFLNKGIGTQQVLAILQRLFPTAVIERADLDTTSKKKVWQQTLQNFYDKKIDILVGTQSISKGYHFPHVTLVGILWADVNLHFPMYNAAETTLQQLIQVAGRAGRQSNESRVIVQTMTPHALFNFINEQDYLKFYTSEIIKRQEVGYPPAKHIAEIEIRHNSQQIVEQDAQAIVDQLIDLAGEEVMVLGPVPAVIYRVQRTFCQKIFLKSMSRGMMMQLFSQLKKTPYASSLFFTIDPVA